MEDNGWLIGVGGLVVQSDFGQGNGWRRFPLPGRVFVPQGLTGRHRRLVQDVVPGE